MESSCWHLVKDPKFQNITDRTFGSLPDLAVQKHVGHSVCHKGFSQTSAPNVQHVQQLLPTAQMALNQYSISKSNPIGILSYTTIALAIFSPRFGHYIREPSTMVRSEMLVGMTTCHSLTIIDGEITGDPLDLIMFNSTNWVCSLSLFKGAVIQLKSYKQF